MTECGSLFCCNQGLVLKIDIWNIYEYLLTLQTLEESLLVGKVGDVALARFVSRRLGAAIKLWYAVIRDPDVSSGLPCSRLRFIFLNYSVLFGLGKL